MTLEVAARLAVLLACAGAAGTLYVLAASPVRVRPADEAASPAQLPGLVPAALVAFVLLAGGTALTGAGTVGTGPATDLVTLAGIALLAVVGWVAARGAARALAGRGSVDATVAPSAGLVVLAWAGAALALASWVLAVGAAVLALLAGVRVERRAR